MTKSTFERNKFQGGTVSDTKILRVEEVDALISEINYGVHTTLTSMFGLKPEPRPHRMEKECSVQGDVSGIVSLIQEKTEGTIVVSFPKKTILAMLSKVYRKDFTEINQSVQMGVGELTNIIYGVVKANLNKNGYALKMAIPNVILGDQHTVVPCAAGPILAMPYDTPAGEFTVIMAFHRDQAGQAA